MQKRVNLCLVGVGRVSTSHFEAIANLSELVNLTAVMSRNENNLKIAADKWGAQKTYSSYEKMLKNPDIDAVIICLPHHLHESTTITAAQAKKNILCEKPMAITGQQCRNMVKAADDNNVTLMIGQSRRFYDAVLKSKEIISEGNLGKILSINEWNYSLRVEAHPSSWRLDMDKSGGRIMPLWGAHLLDYILWVMEKKTQIYLCQDAFK